MGIEFVFDVFEFLLFFKAIRPRFLFPTRLWLIERLILNIPTCPFPTHGAINSCTFEIPSFGRRLIKRATSGTGAIVTFPRAPATLHFPIAFNRVLIVGAHYLPPDGGAHRKLS